MKAKTRQTLLIVVMVVVCLLVLRKYLPAIQLPTAARVAQKQRELKSMQSDLLVARKTRLDKLAETKSMQSLAEPFWVPSSPAAKVDQEISAEFNRITRMAQLTTATGSQKVDVNKEKNGSCLQEVILSVDFKNVSMRDLARFFLQLRTAPNGKKFRWDYCKIQPDNPRTPSAVNLSARFRVLVLNNDAMTLMGFVQPTEAAAASAPAATPAAGKGVKPKTR